MSGPPDPATEALGPCPRCASPLTAGAGALGEAGCSACAARFLDAPVVDRVRELFLKIEAPLLLELARAGVPSQPCPRCRTTLRAQPVRGVTVDLCPGCGGALLDAGELLTWSRGAVAEVRAPPPPAPMAADQIIEDGAPQGGAIADAAGGWPTLRWMIACTSCDQELDVTAAAYAVNDRPWCVACVDTQGLGAWRHILSMTIGPLIGAFAFLLGVLLQGRRRGAPLVRWGTNPWSAWGHALAPVSPSAVVEKVPAGQVGARFARFAQRARG